MSQIVVLVRCYTCGMVIGNKEDVFLEAINPNHIEIKSSVDILNLKNECENRQEIYDHILKFDKHCCRGKFDKMTSRTYNNRVSSVVVGLKNPSGINYKDEILYELSQKSKIHFGETIADMDEILNKKNQLVKGKENKNELLEKFNLQKKPNLLNKPMIKEPIIAQNEDEEDLLGDIELESISVQNKEMDFYPIPPIKGMPLVLSLPGDPSNMKESIDIDDMHFCEVLSTRIYLAE